MYVDGFETARLIIRKLTLNDIPVWAEFFLDRDMLGYIGIEKDADACTQSKEWINRQLKRYENGEFGLMALIDKATMSFVGQCGIIKMNVRGDEELEIGYHIIKKYRGMGYALEAANCFIDHAFSIGSIEKVITVVHIENIPSINLSLKLGFKPEGETICMGKPSFRYSITREELKRTGHSS